MFSLKKASTYKIPGGKTSYPMGALLRLSPKIPVYRPTSFAVWFPGFTQVLVRVLPSLNYFCALEAAVKSICPCISTCQSPVWLDDYREMIKNNYFFNMMCWNERFRLPKETGDFGHLHFWPSNLLLFFFPQEKPEDHLRFLPLHHSAFFGVAYGWWDRSWTNQSKNSVLKTETWF